MTLSKTRETKKTIRERFQGWKCTCIGRSTQFVWEWREDSKLLPTCIRVDNDNTRIEFEMRIGMNEFDHRIVALLKQKQERPERGFEP